MLLSLGALLIFIGAIWFIILSFQTQNSMGMKILWAVVNFLFQPIGGIIFYVVNRVGTIPLILVILGAILYGAHIFTSPTAIYPR